MYFRKALINIIRKPLGQKLLLWLFEHMNFAIPIHRIIDTPDVLAFYHPEPSYALHILLVPKRQISTFTALTPQDDPLLLALMRAARMLIQQFNLDESEYRIIINGGTNQEVPILHIHLVSDTPAERLNK